MSIENKLFESIIGHETLQQYYPGLIINLLAGNFKLMLVGRHSTFTIISKFSNSSMLPQVLNLDGYNYWYNTSLIVNDQNNYQLATRLAFGQYHNFSNPLVICNLVL